MTLGETMSLRERKLCCELLVDVVVAVYYFANALPLLAAPEPQLTTMAGLVVKCVLLSIVLSIIVFSIAHVGAPEQPADERDRLFDARGNGIAYVTLLVCLCVVMFQVSASQLFPARAPFPTTPMIVVHLLLLCILLSSAVKALVQLISYRRGY